MSIRFQRKVTQELTRIGLVLSPRRGRGAGGGWRARLGVARLVAGAGSYLSWWQQPRDLQRLADAAHDQQRLQQALEQARLMLRVSEARGQELERQVDALNQQLHKSQEELTFFRKAREPAMATR